jgi:probable HAF family extracellular repeat protein
MKAAYWGFGGEARAVPGTEPDRFSVVSAVARAHWKWEAWRFVAGTFEAASGELHAFFAPVFRGRGGFLVDNIQDLNTLGGSFSQALGVNSMRQVVGVSETASGDQHAFLWTESGGMEDLGTLGGMSIATGINDQGQVVGYTEAYSTVVAFLWTREEGMVVLPPLEGADGWVAFGINNKGQVVGTSGMEEPDEYLHATMWVLK